MGAGKGEAAGAGQREAAGTGNREAAGAGQTPLTGRDRELDALRAGVTRVAEGAPGTVLLTGPAGVGKTRLAREALRFAEQAGFATFAGRARDLGQEVAYAPAVEAFGGFLRRLGAREREELVGDLPQLGLLFGGLGLEAPAPLGDPALERARLLEGFARLVERLARARPVAMLLDDVHVADNATGALVRSLLVGLADWPLLLVLTARPDEPGRDRVATLGGDLASSAGWTEQLAVAPLGADEAARLVARVLGRPIEERLAELVLERCGGRPLLLEAVSRTLRESGRLTAREGVLHLGGGGVPLPAGVHSQLRRRLSLTSRAEQRVLRVLAVAGGELEVGVLHRAAGLTQRAALAALDHLHRRWLVAERADPEPGRESVYELAHGLLRDALLAELSPPARRQVHHDLVQALEAVRPEDPRIAEQALGAGALIAPQTALVHLTRGGEHARRVGDAENAARYLAGAVAIARGQRGSSRLAGLLSDLGAAQAQLGEHAGARASWTEAAAEYGRRGEATCVARTERELAMLAWSDGDIPDARAHLAAAERVLRDLEPGREHGWLLHAQTVVGVRLGDAAAVGDAARRLRHLASELGSPVLAAHADLAEGAVACAETDYVAAAAHDRRALDAAVAADEPLLGLRAHDQLSVVAAAELDLGALRHHSREAVRIARQLGAATLGGWPRGRLAIVDLLAGDWDAAVRGTSELDALAERLADRRARVSVLAMRAWVLVHRGRLTDAEALLDRARRTAPAALCADRNIFGIVALAEADLALAQNDAARARCRGAELQQPGTGWLQVLGAGVLGEALVRDGELESARRVAAGLREVRSCTTDAPDAVADWVDGLADRAQGEGQRAAERLRRAAAAFDRLGLPYQLARARLAAAAAEAASAPARAIEGGHAALEAFERLDAPIQAREARQLLRALGVTPSRGRARRLTGSALSARELEVARLVASDLSNAEVATRLWISPRTVTTHLDRIYGKLGLSSRVALTRYLADSGLLDEEAAPAP